MNYKKIRLLHVVFNTRIEAYEISAFRGAIIEKVGKENILFHNHLSDSEFVYGYPLIQYMRVGRKPSVICIEQGVNEMYKFFINKEWDMTMAGRKLQMNVSSMNLKDYTIKITGDQLNYRISNWLALNQENYPEYAKLTAITDQVSKLEGILTANILSFAKSIDWIINEPLKIKLTSVSPVKLLGYKGVKLSGFDATFNANIMFPNYLGLGKGVSHGFGTVKQI